MSAHVVLEWARPWGAAQLEVEGAPRLAIHFDRTEAAIREPVRCEVEIERGRGTSMLLATVGLPPGAEVERGDLAALTAVSGPVSRYDVEPSRVVVYVRSSAKFAFGFRPRMAMRAQSLPSRLEDYYNPDASAVVPPVAFDVH